MGARPSAVAPIKNMQVDYKIAEERTENGKVVYQRVKYFEGETVTVPAVDLEGKPIKGTTVELYRRTKLVKEVEYNYGAVQEKTDTLNYLNKELRTVATEKAYLTIDKQNTVDETKATNLEKKVIKLEKPKAIELGTIIKI